MNIRAHNRRLSKLELHFARATRDPLSDPNNRLRLVVEHVFGQPNPQVPQCRRYLNERGGVIEVVHLYGDQTRMSEEERDAFIARFPVTNSMRADQPAAEA